MFGQGTVQKGGLKEEIQCYLVVSSAKTFADASTHCKLKEANLASVHGKIKMKFLDRYLTSKNYWIGLNDRKKENTFVWTDGTKVNYQNWGKKQPDNYKNEDCVELDRKALGYVFNDNKCTQKNTIRLQNERYVFDAPKRLFTTKLIDKLRNKNEDETKTQMTQSFNQYSKNDLEPKYPKSIHSCLRPVFVLIL